MARSFHLLTGLLTGLLGASALAETPTTPGSTPQPRRGAGGWLSRKFSPSFDGTPSPELENVRRALDALTPEQRKRFQENFIRWANLSPEEKKALRDREEVRKKLMQQEVEAAMRESGLNLEGPQKAAFVKRYAEERRKIEEQLRKETNEKRKPLVREMIGRLKGEFSETGSGTVAAPQ